MKPLAWPGSPLSDLHLCQKNQLKSLRWPRTIDVYKHVLLPKIMLSTVLPPARWNLDCLLGLVATRGPSSYPVVF